ncbi:hypothetical protein FMM56_00105 [Campylobacter sp. LR264d]|uniref:hypothetical protein n=1 Tax=Campylobacter sp. LR264d TaxID=2593544 RepID=UPI00123A199B|nr:hypothetical protein [Campylobacter sp. LR264d]KAA6234454.1 hypothetical protein FMM56_00105 [Campylobacter sp. LR264d]
MKELQCKTLDSGYYETCRFAWKIDPQRAKNHPYVLCVLNGVVKEVYKVNGDWKPDSRYVDNRYEFESEVAQEYIRQMFKDKRIPEKYRKKGQVYSKSCNEN